MEDKSQSSNGVTCSSAVDPSYYAQGPGLDLQHLGTVRGSLEM